MSKAKTKESVTLRGESVDEGVSMLAMLARELPESRSGEFGVDDAASDKSSKSFLAFSTDW